MAHAAERLSKAVATARATVARLRKLDDGAQAKKRVFHDIELAIDRPKGFVQRGKAADGTEWERTYLYDYGEIPGTQGGDGEGLDVFVGDDEAASNAYWILQIKADGSFDEYKVLLGFTDGGAAREAYVAHIPEKFLGGMAMTSVEMIKALIGLAPIEVMKRLALEEIARVLDVEETRIAKGKDNQSVITITTRPDADITVTKIAKTLQRAGQVGAGTEVLYETGGGLFKLCGFDGDGPSAIERIELNGELVESSNEDFEPEDRRVASSANSYAAKGAVEPPPEAPAPADRMAEAVAIGKAAPGNDNAEERYVLGIVLKPEEVDLQGDIYSAEEIRRTAHLWLARYRNTDRNHKELINPLLDIVESYLAPVDMLLGEKLVTAGTWLLAVRVSDDTLWKQIKSGELTGFSIRGWSKKTMLAAA